ncbi:MAG: hypothetical protein OEY01_03595 [Desulfobulbaceae bacterium]|nr:hypothetical protein [Desulfobulbaceae bacterium]
MTINKTILEDILEDNGCSEEQITNILTNLEREEEEYEEARIEAMAAQEDEWRIHGCDDYYDPILGVSDDDFGLNYPVNDAGEPIGYC